MKLLKTLKNPVVMLGFALAACLMSALLARLYPNDNAFAGPLFILAVAMTARFTDGYVWGILSAAIAVICVNTIFTYPYWEFNLTISGYPLTFTVMLLVALIISTLTTQIKRQENSIWKWKKRRCVRICCVLYPMTSAHR